MAKRTTKKKKLTPCLEDYLEAILAAIRENRVARVRDIAGHLHVGMPAVTSALKTLAGRKLVNYEPYQYITLTDRGRQLASEISRRHELLCRFLVEVLGVRRDTAEANACRMEHVIDSDVLEKLRKLTQFARECPGNGKSWIELFQKYCAEENIAGAAPTQQAQA